MARRRSSKEDQGCGILVLGAIILVALVTAVREAVRWLGEDYNMTWVTAVIGTLITLIYVVHSARTLRAASEGTAASVVGGAAPLLALLTLVVAVSVYSFAESTVAGIVALTIGGFGVSFIGWSWWRPLHLRIGMRVHFPWWWHGGRWLISAAGASAIVAVGLTAVAAGVAGERLQERRDSAKRHIDRARIAAADGDFKEAGREIRAAEEDGADRDSVSAAREAIRDRRRTARTEERQRRIRALVLRGSREVADNDAYAVETTIAALRHGGAQAKSRRLATEARDAWLARARRSSSRGDFLQAADLAAEAATLASSGGARAAPARSFARGAEAAYDKQSRRELDTYDDGLGEIGGGGGGSGGGFDVPGIPGL